ncbi:MAG: protein-tyrosine-phosphatase [Planctomycetota bacterium]|nr:MAG: protein-tyrosine-phosphatase [Planctomycetota bacterium]
MTTRLELITDADEHALEVASSALDAGQLVVVPTETVYGVAAREDRPEALAALERLKGARRTPYSRAVSGFDALGPRLLHVPRIAQRVAERWWPGPVTQVLRAADGAWLGLRVPGHAWTRALCERVGVPLLLPSANSSGAPAPRELNELEPQLAEQVALMVDAGPCALGEASTVLQVDTASARVLRAGVLSRADLQAHARGVVLVVCSGNTCRSPMGAELLREALEQRAQADPDFLPPHVISAGTMAGPGQPASPGAAGALAQRGLSLEAHVSQPVELELLESADLVLCMTSGHLAALAPHAAALGCELELFDPSGESVEDPFGAPLSVYASVARELARMAAQRVAQLCASTESSA